jgi:hypothetical protein
MALDTFLSCSSATDDFRSAVLRFVREGTPCERIRFNAGCPPVKIARTLTRILAAFPQDAIERVELDGRSGCEYFRGTALVVSGSRTRRVRFHWDCKWRAEQLGWTDYFGFADQARAAREYDWDCFRTWDEADTYAKTS